MKRLRDQLASMQAAGFDAAVLTGAELEALLDVAERAEGARAASSRMEYPVAGPIPSQLSPHFRVLGAEWRLLLDALDRLREVTA